MECCNCTQIRLPAAIGDKIHSSLVVNGTAGIAKLNHLDLSRLFNLEVICPFALMLFLRVMRIVDMNFDISRAGVLPLHGRPPI